MKYLLLLFLIAPPAYSSDIGPSWGIGASRQAGVGFYVGSVFGTRDPHEALPKYKQSPLDHNKGPISGLLVEGGYSEFGGTQTIGATYKTNFQIKHTTLHPYEIFEVCRTKEVSTPNFHETTRTCIHPKESTSISIGYKNSYHCKHFCGFEVNVGFWQIKNQTKKRPYVGLGIGF